MPPKCRLTRVSIYGVPTIDPRDRHANSDQELVRYAREWTLHDLRRTAATRMADIGVPPHVIEEVLNHRSGHRSGVAGIYNRSRYEREVKAAVATWDRHVTALIEGREQRKVVPIRSAGHDNS
jgi:integrase